MTVRIGRPAPGRVLVLVLVLVLGQLLSYKATKPSSFPLRASQTLAQNTTSPAPLSKCEIEYLFFVVTGNGSLSLSRFVFSYTRCERRCVTCDV